MALEAALGVQYLHHHRYWSDGGKRHNGATNKVEQEEAGWKVRASVASARGGASEASEEGPARASEVRASEVRASEVRASEVRASEVRASEVRASEVRASEVRASEARANEAFPGLLRCVRVGRACN
jgi:hypothetical protein